MAGVVSAVRASERRCFRMTRGVPMNVSTEQQVAEETVVRVLRHLRQRRGHRAHATLAADRQLPHARPFRRGSSLRRIVVG